MIMYSYSFISTTEDLLNAEEADRTVRTFRAPFRASVLAMGFLWLIAGIASFGTDKSIGRSLAWVFIGVGIISYFLVKPYMVRRNIKKYSKNQCLTLGFFEDRIEIKAGDEKFLRKWEELRKYVLAKKGVIFYFNDGTINWLPNTVFLNKEARENFISFLSNKADSSAEMLSKEVDAPQEDK